MTTTTDDRPRARIDPRIRDRRIAVRRDEGRRRLKLVAAAAALVVALAAGIGLTRSPFLDVDHVRVVGGEHTALADLTKATGVRDGQAMVDLDEGALARRAAALPWVATVKVARRWPGTVVFTITERAPLAAVPATGGGWALTDRTGRVLADVLVPPPDRPTLAGVLAGPPGSSLPATAAPVLATALALPPALLAQVAAIEPDGAADARAGDVALELRPAGAVRLGSPSGLDAKMTALATMLAQVDLRNVVLIDLRVPESPALRRS